MDSDHKAAGPPPAYGSEMYIMLIQLDTTLLKKKTIYEDINLMDLETAGPPPANSSKTYM